jgi:alanine racemase
MEVDLDRVKDNLFKICKKTCKKTEQVIAVVKDNSYGLGAAAVAKVLQNTGVVWFAVAAVDEALFLRENGITGDILVLGITDENCFKAASQHNITLSIIDRTQLSVIEKNYRDCNFKWHLNIDTGMHRDGIMYDWILNGNTEFVEKLVKLKSVINGVYTHFHSSDSKKQKSVVLQQNNFKKAISALQNAGFNFDIIHASNSGACAYSNVGENEYIRPGTLLYGCRPDPNRDTGIDVYEAVKICSRISSVRYVKKGQGVSYGNIWKAPENTKIATIQIGYADGFPRVISKTAFVIIKGKKYPVVGRITMDYIMANIGSETEINVGDEVVIAGKSDNLQISVDELAQNARTIGYELMCKFGGLMNHKYILNGQVISFHKRELF